MIRKHLVPAAVALAVAFPAFAAGTVELNDENTAKIRTYLTGQGYEVAKIKIEDGLYEAYARKDGERFEVFLDAEFNIVRIEDD